MFSTDQYDAARQRAAVLDRSSQGKIAVAGADRASFLHGLLTNDIAGLASGAGVYSAYLTPQGRMISDMRVIETGQGILLDVEPALAASLAERLDRLVFSEDVQVSDVTSEWAEVGVHGPSAAALLRSVTGLDVSQLTREYDNVSEGGRIVVRDAALGVPGFDLYVPMSERASLLSRMVEAGATQMSAVTAETLRVEAGRPRFGIDMSADTIPLEAGIESRAISLTKGCYVGQEVIVRILHRGHGRVARRLVGLLLTGGIQPAHGDVIAAGEQEVGRVTSAAVSPSHHAPIALGYVQRDHAAVGTHLAVRTEAGRLEAEVHQLPFVGP